MTSGTRTDTDQDNRVVGWVDSNSDWDTDTQQVLTQIKAGWLVTEVGTLTLINV